MPAPVNTITPAQAATFANGLRDPDSFPRQLLRLAVLLTAWPLVLVWKAPILITTLAVSAAAVYAVHLALTDWTVIAAAVLAPALLLALWRTVHRSSFAPLGAWLLGCTRCGLVYRWRWRRLTIACGLAQKDREGDPVPPRLVRVISRPGRDELRVRLLPGQTPDDYLSRVVQLAHAFRVGHSHPEYIDRVTARCDKSGTVTLTFPRADPLRREVPRFAPIPVDRLDLEALPVARVEDGSTWQMPLLYKHVLVAGASGSGKGSALWSIMAGLAPGIPAGLVHPWGIDPKGGMELALGRALFHRLAYGGTDDDLPKDKAARLVAIADELQAVVSTRADRYAGKTRKFTPSMGEPLIVLIIDELAFLTAYMPFTDLRKQFSAALSVILTQGRAVGVSVVALLQDPRKETVPQRSLFPVKIGLRLDTDDESRMVLGDAAWKRGAHCEETPQSLPGTGYVLLDGKPTPRRVRFTHVTDDDVTALARTYPTPPPAPPAALAVVPALDQVVA